MSDHLPDDFLNPADYLPDEVTNRGLTSSWYRNQETRSVFG